MRKPFVLAVLLLVASTLHAQTPQYALAVSRHANLALPSFLATDSVLTGNEYVFSSSASALNASPIGIHSACYWLDRPATGTADHCERVAPYNLKGTVGCSNGTGACPAAWNTAALPDGWHRLTQIITLASGGSELDTTRFRTYNGSLLSLTAVYDDGSAVLGTVALQSLSSSNVPAATATEPLITGTATYKLVLQLDTIYTVSLIRTDGTVLASFPFVLPRILKLDPAALRSATLALIFRRSDLALKQATPQVTFDF